MDQLITDRLRDNLTRLNLIRASEVLEDIAQQAETDKRSYLSFLDQLLEEEVAVKEKRRFQTAMKTAGLPTAKSIDEYDFGFHPQLNKKEIMALFDMDFISKKENVIFLGPPGVGKTHLAISLAIKACSHGFKVYFTTMDTLIRKLQREPVQPQGLSDLALGGGRRGRAICPSTAARRICSSSSSPTATSAAPPSSPPTRASPTGRNSSGMP